MRATEFGANRFCQWLFLFRPVLFQLFNIPFKFYTLCTGMSSSTLLIRLSEFNFPGAYAMIKLQGNH